MNLKINFFRYRCQKEVTTQIHDITQIKFHHTVFKIIRYLKESELLDFIPGFFDSINKKSRLTRIKPKKKLIDEFKKVKLNKSYSIHHEKREFIYLYKNNILSEYNDNFKTHELREILNLYNKIIQKNYLIFLIMR